MRNFTPTIYYLEDDPEDIEILSYVLMILGIKVNIIHLEDGKKGLQKLYESKEQNSLPSLVLVDINMPILNGMQVVIKLKEDEVLKQLPTVVLSTSTKEKAFFDTMKVEMIKKPSGDVKKFLEDIKRIFTPFIDQVNRANS